MIFPFGYFLDLDNNRIFFWQNFYKMYNILWYSKIDLIYFGICHENLVFTFPFLKLRLAKIGLLFFVTWQPWYPHTRSLLQKCYWELYSQSKITSRGSQSETCWMPKGREVNGTSYKNRTWTFRGCDVIGSNFFDSLTSSTVSSQQKWSLFLLFIDIFGLNVLYNVFF